MSTMINRRKFLKMAGTGIAGAVLVACAPAATQAPQVGETSVPTAALPEAEEVSLEFVMNDSTGWSDAVNKMMAKYMELHPNVKVRFNPVAFDQLTVVLPPRFAAGEPPDLLYCDAFWPWVQQGLVIDLNPFIQSDDIDLSKIADTGAGVIIGRPERYGLPFDFTGSVVAFNKTHFDKYGVEYPKEGWTTDDLQRMAIQLTRDANDKSPEDSGFDPANIKVYGTYFANGYFVGPLVKMFGGQPWSEDGKSCLFAEPNALEAFKYIGDLACQNHALLGPGVAPGDVDPFAAGMTAITFEGEWQLPLYKDITDFDWDCAAWPNGPKANYQYGGSDALGIAKASKHIDEAWSFAKYWIFEKEPALTTGAIMAPALNEAGLDDAILRGRIGGRGPSYENLVWAYTNMRTHSDCSIYYMGNHQELWYPVVNDTLASLLTLCNEPSVEGLITKAADQITEIMQKEG